MQGDAGSASRRRFGQARSGALLVCLIASLAVAAGILPAIAADAASTTTLSPSEGALLGAYVKPRPGETREQAVTRFESTVGHLAVDHQYYQWNSAIPTPYDRWTADLGRIPFLNWKAPGSWGQIASGAEDSWIALRADAFKAFGRPVYLSFHHEPENDPSFGTPSEYAAAYRRIVDIFRARGVTNVGFVWTMMAWTFDPRSGLSPMSWYPGDEYVDLVGSDGYNWYPGRPDDEWRPFSQVFETSRGFALSRGKPWIVVETGVQEDPDQPGRKGAWFRDMLATAMGWSDLKAIVYFDSDKRYPWWVDTSASSVEGFREALESPWFSRSGSSPQTTTGPPAVPSTTTGPPAGPSTTTSPPSVASTTPGSVLVNSFDAGVSGWPVIGGWSRGLSGNAFDSVTIESGTALTYDASSVWSSGLAARVVVQDRRDAFVEWGPSFGRPSAWYGRVYVRFDTAPQGDVRLVRAKDAGTLVVAIDVVRSGRVRVMDRSNRSIAITSEAIDPGSWARIEWMVDHEAGIAEVRVFADAFSESPTAVARTSSGSSIGTGASQIQIGRSGSQQFAASFWIDEPGLSRLGYLGPAT